MKNKSKLKILPSKIILSNGNTVILNELKKKEREKVKSLICKNISKHISTYYSLKNEEWKNFISEII